MKNNSFFSTTVCCTSNDCCFLIKNMFNYVAVVKFHLAEWIVQVELAGFGQKSHEGFLKVIIASMRYLNHTVSVPEVKGLVVSWHFQDKTGSRTCIEISLKWKKYCGSDKQKEIALSRGSTLHPSVKDKWRTLAKLLKTCQNSRSKCYNSVMVCFWEGWEDDKEEDMRFLKHPPLQAPTNARQKDKTLWLFWLKGWGCRSISTLSKTGSDTKSRVLKIPVLKVWSSPLSHFIQRLKKKGSNMLKYSGSKYHEI